MFRVMGVGVAYRLILYSPLLQKSKSKLSRELSDLVVYCKSVHFHGFKHACLHGKCYEMSSFSESKAKRLAKEAGTISMREQCVLEKGRELLNLKWISYSSDKISYLFNDYETLYMCKIVYLFT